MKKFLELILCKLLKKHHYKDEMCPGLYEEGWDEWKRCSLCGAIKCKHMRERKNNE